MLEAEKEIAAEVERLQAEGRKYTEKPPVNNLSKYFQTSTETKGMDDEFIEDRIY